MFSDVSVNGRPSNSMPWCSKGSIMVSRVVSLPPCMLPLLVNTHAGLPTSSPLSRSRAVPSQKYFIAAAMLPNRVGLPKASAANIRTGHAFRHKGTVWRDAVAVASQTVETAGTVRIRARQPGTGSDARAIRWAVGNRTMMRVIENRDFLHIERLQFGCVIVQATLIHVLALYVCRFAPPGHAAVRNGYGFVGFVLNRYQQDQCLQTAGSLTFTTLLALVPLLTIVVMWCFRRFRCLVT